MKESRWEGEAARVALPTSEPGRFAIHFPPFRLDALNERLWRGQQPIALRPKTFAVLRYLLERPQQLIRKEELLDRLWGDVSVSEAVLKTYLREIRQALGDSARSPRFIETAHRRGYRFIGRVLTERESAPASAAPSAPPATTTAKFATPPPPPEAFVGRELELRRLEDAWLEAQRGQRQLIFVTGEPGIGKTTLVQAFLQRLGSEHAFAWGQCVDQYGAGEAYLPLLEGLRRLARGPLRRELARAVRREAPTWLAHLPGLMERVDAPAASTHALAAPPERMLCEMAEALEALTLEQPLIFWLEDLHWADPSTLACLSYLARRADPARLLLIGSYRPLAIRTGHPLEAVHPELLLQEHCDEIKLGFLSPVELGQYFSRRFRAQRFPSNLFDWIHAQTAGNPLFLDRIVDSWLKRGVVVERDGCWQLTLALDSLARDTPVSVALMIEREIDLLDGFERSLLEAASAAGMDFSTAALAAALGEDLVRVEELCLRWTRRRQFFQHQGHSEWPDGTIATRCEFIHAVYRQVAYERVGRTRRAQLHERIGARQEAAYGPRAREIAPELALHFERGQNPRKAAAYHAAAGEQALRRSACREAIDHFERGLLLLDRLAPDPELRRLELELLVALGSSLAMTRGHAAAEVEQVYARARRLCAEQSPTTQLFQALMGIGAFYLVRGEYRTACSLSAEFLALARQHPDPDVTLEATLLEGMSRIFLGDLRGAQAQLEHTIQLYDPEHHDSYIFLFMQDPGVCAHSLLTLPLWILGFPQRALELAERALELAHELDHPAAFVLAYLSLAQVEQFRGEPARCRAHAEAGLQLSLQHGFDLYRETLGMLLGVALFEQGETDAGLARIEASWRELQRSGSEFAGARWRSLLAAALARAARRREAFELLGQAFARVQSHEDRWWEPELYRVLGELLAHPEGDTDAPELPAHVAPFTRTAEACWRRALELARHNEARAFELRAALALARLWKQRGELQSARCLLRESYGKFTEGFDCGDLRAARELLAELGSG